jgi:hypothetical protein
MGSKWTLGRLVGGGGGVDAPGSGYGSSVGSCECGDELSDSGSMELASYHNICLEGVRKSRIFSTRIVDI